MLSGASSSLCSVAVTGDHQALNAAIVPNGTAVKKPCAGFSLMK